VVDLERVVGIRAAISGVERIFLPALREPEGAHEKAVRVDVTGGDHVAALTGVVDGSSRLIGQPAMV
jgi:hypothetical protein